MLETRQNASSREFRRTKINEINELACPPYLNTMKAWRLFKECAPYHKKNVKAVENLPAIMEALREKKEKHLDIWVDGSLYPKDPVTGCFVPFQNVSQFLQFVCDGESGLLGYCQNLEKFCSQEMSDYLQISQREHYQVSQERDTLLQLLGTVNQRTSQEKETYIQEIKSLSDENSLLRQLMSEHGKQVSKLQTNYSILEAELKQVKEVNTATIQERDVSLKRLLQRWGKRKRQPMKNIEDLSSHSGNKKKRIKAMKCTLVTKNLLSNPESIGESIGAVLKTTSSRVMLKNPRFQNVVRDLTDKTILNVQKSLHPGLLQGICDTAGMSRKCYKSVYNVLHKASKFQKLRKMALPRPNKVILARRFLNQQFTQIIGNPLHITDMYVSNNDSFEYNITNNFYLDLTRLLQYMINFYEICESDVNGKLLVVIKLDESEIVKGQKLERVSISFMNEELRNDRGEKIKMSVQSENDIWWLFAFQVPKEDHSILKWIFGKTDYPEIIANHMSGQKLTVSELGSFEMEWHLAGDLKTLKCMYNISHGANAKHPCLYCMSDCKNLKVPRSVVSPTRENEDVSWSPVLPIPLCNVHICTMHAEVRIIEKLLHNHCIFAWNMKPESSSKIAIRRLTNVLSKAGLQKGNVRIEKSLKLSGKSGNIPDKISLSGTKARKFLSNHSGKPSKVSFGLWKDIISATYDFEAKGDARLKKAAVWENLDEVIRLLRKDNFTHEDIYDLSKSCSLFVKSVAACWGEAHITHYMHILLHHVPFFAQKYGSLSVWSSQGMEKSH